MPWELKASFKCTLWFHQTWPAGKSPNWMEVLVGIFPYQISMVHFPLPCLIIGASPRSPVPSLSRRLEHTSEDKSQDVLETSPLTPLAAVDGARDQHWPSPAVSCCTLWLHQTWPAGTSPKWMEVLIAKSPNQMIHFPSSHVWWNRRVASNHAICPGRQGLTGDTAHGPISLECFSWPAPGLPFMWCLWLPSSFRSRFCSLQQGRFSYPLVTDVAIEHDHWYWIFPAITWWSFPQLC